MAWRRSVATGRFLRNRVSPEEPGRSAIAGCSPARRPLRTAPEPGFPDGRITRWIGTCTDIDDMVRAREVLARTRDELERRVAERTAALTDTARELAAEIRRREEAQATLLQTQKLEALGQLTGGLAHDFNNVLAAILGSLDLVQRRLQDPKLIGFIGNARRRVGPGDPSGSPDAELRAQERAEAGRARPGHAAGFGQGTGPGRRSARRSNAPLASIPEPGRSSPTAASWRSRC